MKTIKINYVDYHKDYDFRDDLIYHILSKRYNVKFSDNPDYVFYSCFGFEHLNVSDDCVVIFVTGEEIEINKICSSSFYLVIKKSIQNCGFSFQNFTILHAETQ